MKKAVVTGGAGFIGSHIIEHLVDREVRVIALDTLKPSDAANIAHLLSSKFLEYIEGSIDDCSVLDRIFADSDYVFHHAASPNPPAGTVDYTGFYDANSRTVLKVLQSAKNNRVKKVILASSCAVYGDVPAQKLSEDLLPRPQTPYAVCKLIAEHYCDIFSGLHQLPTVSLRYFNVYGPRQNPDSPLASVIPKFIRTIRQGKSPLIFGDGEQTRDFVYVKDAVKANLLAAESEAQGVYNIGTGRSVSLNQLLEKIMVLMQRDNIKPAYKDARPGDIKHSLADIRKAGAFGYAPEYGLNQGLREMLADSNT